MPFWEATLLGLLQGITEFLPISSSGHLVLAQHLMGMAEENLLFDTVLHAGTALSIVVVFHRDLLRLIADSLSPDPVRRGAAWRYTGFILLGTIPAAVAGVAFKDFFTSLFSNARATSLMLIITGGLLLSTRFVRSREHRITLLAALIIGCAQATAILPGISRSGATIAVALLVGVSREEAGRFSFLLALPAILGALILQLPDLGETRMALAPLAAGFAISFISGIGACLLLLAFVRRGKLHFFSWYCAFAGLAGLFLIS